MKISLRLKQFEGRWKLLLLRDYIMKWADIRPDNDCIVFADTGQAISYRAFDEANERMD